MARHPTDYGSRRPRSLVLGDGAFLRFFSRNSSIRALRGARGDVQELQGAWRGAVLAFGRRRVPRATDAAIEGALRAPTGGAGAEVRQDLVNHRRTA